MISQQIISSSQNPRIKEALRLREKKERDSRKLMIIDGYRAISLALDNRVSLKELFFCEKFLRLPEERKLIGGARKKGARVFCLEEKAFVKIAYGDNPEGLLAIAEKPEKKLADLPIGKSALYIILESLEKPGNLGAILRSADATGTAAVIVCNNQTDIYNPNVIRSSRGAFFAVPTIEASAQNIIQWINKNRIKTIVTTPVADWEYTAVHYPYPCAIVLGGEHQGVSSLWLKAADFKVKIPMKGVIDSLNVSVAAAIMLYEALRQRSAK